MRVLSYNVAALLRAVPGTHRTFPVTVEEMPIADDLDSRSRSKGRLTCRAPAAESWPAATSTPPWLGTAAAA